MHEHISYFSRVPAAVFTLQLDGSIKYGGGGKVIIQKFKQCPPGTTSVIAIKIHYGTCNMIVEILPDHEILMLHIKI